MATSIQSVLTSLVALAAGLFLSACSNGDFAEKKSSTSPSTDNAVSAEQPPDETPPPVTEKTDEEEVADKKPTMSCYEQINSLVVLFSEKDLNQLIDENWSKVFEQVAKISKSEVEVGDTAQTALKLFFINFLSGSDCNSLATEQNEFLKVIAQIVPFLKPAEK